MKKIVIFGATSGIANACALEWIRRYKTPELFLVARHEKRLIASCNDYEVRGAKVHGHIADLNDLTDHAALLDEVFTKLGNVDIALIAHATRPDQVQCETDTTKALEEISTNGLSAISLMNELGARLEKQDDGVLAIISSVAGDRGRRSNYVYGSAKAAVTAFASGLRARLSSGGAHVLTIKPGFVDTPLAQGLGLPPLMVASPNYVARSICRAIERRRNSIYTPFFWWWIMTAIRMTPEALFKRTNL